MDEQKRLREMEASIKAIAQFVKDQTEKLEEQLGSKGANDIEYLKDEMEELKRRIESFGDEKEFSRLQFKKLDKLEENLDERISKLEENARQKGDEKLKKTLQDTRAGLDSLRRDLMSKVQFMEQKMDKINRPELNLEDLTMGVEKLEREVKELRDQRKAAPDYRKELDRASSEIMSGVKSRMSEHERVLNDISDKIGNFDPHTQIEELRNDVYSKINKIQNSAQPASNDELEQLTEKVGMIDRKLNESLMTNSRLADVERNLTEMRTTLGKMKGFDADSYKKELEKHIASIQPARHYSAGDNDIEQIKEALEDESVSRVSLEKRLDDMASKLENYEKYMRDSLSQANKTGFNDVKNINKSLEQIRDHELKEIRELANQLVKEREEMEKEVVNRMSLERKVNEMEQKMKNINMAAEEVEDLDIDRVSLERRVQLIDNKLRDMQGSLQKLGNLENLDMPKLAGRLQDMESNMKMQTIKILTQQLNDFAKSLDRRLPNIVSREEYMRQIADINQHMKTIEAPDLSPLGARVSRLEKTIEEVAAMMRSMYNRVPIVVE